MNKRPPMAGPTKPAELSTASSIPNSPPICEASARVEHAEDMDVFMIPRATITAAITAYTIMIEEAIIAITLPKASKLTQINKTLPFTM